MKKILVVEATFYQDLATELRTGACEVLENKNIEFDIISVPGALEIPAVISLAAENNLYDGYVALGCVIRGETTHYDYVCSESARALMDLSVHKHLCIGNGILTVENYDQAWARAKRDKKNKGAFAANAAITMIEIKNKFKRM